MNDIRWRCQINPPTFTSSDAGEWKHISYLGFNVYIPDIDPIDLTDWINTIRWKGNVEPSLSDIFSLWCCENGTPYFNKMAGAKVEIITDSGNIHIKGLNETARTNSSNERSQPQ
jgi:hypothetical protein